MEEDQFKSGLPVQKIVFRSMRDDLKRQTAPAMPASRSKLLSEQTDQTKPSPTLPLPPKNKTGGVVLIDNKNKPMRGLVKALMIFLVLIIIAGVAGISWWYGRGFLAQSEDEQAIELSAVAAAMLPSEAELIVQYKLAGASDRSEVQAVWQTVVGTEQATDELLLSGNPLSLLSAEEIDEFYYIFLPDNPRPFLLVPAGEQIKSILARIPASVAESQGWIIAHALDSASYLAALGSSTLATTGGQEIIASASGGAPVRFSFGVSVMQGLRASLLSERARAGAWQSLVLAGRFTPDGTALEIAGDAGLISLTADNLPAKEQVAAPEAEPITTPQANQQLMSLVPADASFVHLGANFSEDLLHWQQNSGALGQAALESLAAKNILAQLATTYVFFTNTSSTGSPAYGLVVELPPVKENGQSIEPGAIIEQVLVAVAPLLTGQTSIAPISFNDNVYAELPHRFAKLAGTTSAINYAITDSHLLVATSKQSMFDLIDTSVANLASLEQNEDFSEAVSKWGVLPTGKSLIFARIKSDLISKVLPISRQDINIILSISAAKENKQIPLTGIVVFGTTKQIADDTLSDQTSPSPIPFPHAEPTTEIPPSGS